VDAHPELKIKMPPGFNFKTAAKWHSRRKNEGDGIEQQSLGIESHMFKHSGHWLIRTQEFGVLIPSSDSFYDTIYTENHSILRVLFYEYFLNIQALNKRC